VGISRHTICIEFGRRQGLVRDVNVGDIYAALL
jgi:hypothetical protein